MQKKICYKRKIRIKNNTKKTKNEIKISNNKQINKKIKKSELEPEAINKEIKNLKEKAKKDENKITISNN